MRTKHRLYLGTAAVALTVLLAPLASVPNAQVSAVAIDGDDIGGVVSGPKGPEAGVWVIAETTDLPTKYAKIVVTDDQGRYLIPDLPKAKYQVWVRGYGLVDSQKVEAEPGRNLNLRAVVAPNDKAAAEHYPPIYWYSMLKVPAKSEFPGTGPKGNGINPNSAQPAPMARGREEPRLSGVPFHGHSRYARDPAGVRRFRQLTRRLDPPHPGRPGDDRNGQRDHAPRARSRHQGMGRLDRPRRRRRTAERQAAPAAGRRAQPCADDLGLERSQVLPARHDRD